MQVFVLQVLFLWEISGSTKLACTIKKCVLRVKGMIWAPSCTQSLKHEGLTPLHAPFTKHGKPLIN